MNRACKIFFILLAGLLHRGNDRWRLADVPDPFPCWPLTEEPVEGRYLVFSTFPDALDWEEAHRCADIAILDTQARAWTLRKLLDNGGGEVTVCCGSDGRILFSDASGSVEDHWYMTDIESCLLRSE